MRPQTDGVVVYSAVLRPHRSAGPGAARLVVGMVALVWLVAGLVFVVVGAWPVLPFLGLEALLLYGAFRLHQHAGNACEAINLTPRSLTVHRIDHWGKRSEFHFPPHWLQVNLDEPPGRRSPLELRSHGNSLTIGSFLLPEERLRLARSLRRELDRLSAVRHTA